MKTKFIWQMSVGALSLLLLGISAELAAGAVCNSDTSSGKIFGVLDGGKITTDVGNKACNVEFYGASSLGGAYTGPSDGCKLYGSDGKASTTDVTGGDTIARRVLPDFSESPETFGINITVNDITIAGKQYRGSDFVDGKLTVTAGSRTFTIELIGNMNGQHSFKFPGGDYGTIETQGVTASQMSGVEFTGPIRARNLITGSCDKKYGWKFSQDNEAASLSYRRQNYINQFQSGEKMSSQCGIKVPGSKTTINVLGKASLASAVVTGFNFGQSGGCFNFSDEACVKDINNIKVQDMASQEPSWLQINVYNGGVTFSDRIYFAGGLYVPNGKVETTSASGTVLVGEILAANIAFNQGNSGTKFYSGKTASGVLQNKYYSLTPPASDRVIKTGDYIYRATQRDYLADGKTRGTSGHLMAYVLKADSTHDEMPAWDAADPAKMLNRATKIQTEDAGWATTANDFKTLDSSYACVIDPTMADCIAKRASNDPRDPTSLVGVPWRTAPIVVGNSVLFATDDGILYSVNKKNGSLNWGWIPSQVLARTKEENARLYMSTKHSWGQIGSMTVVSASGLTQTKRVFVTGSALGGQLHFSIEIEEDGSGLKNVAWIDYQSGAYSPGSLTSNFNGSNDNSWPGIEGRPYGGAAPVPSVGGTSSNVAYIVGGKLFVRSVDGSGSIPTGVNFVASGGVTIPGHGAASATVITPTSNLLSMGDGRIFFGASDGKVYQSDITGSLDDSSTSVSQFALGTNAVWYVNGTRLVSGDGSALMLTAQTQRRLNVLKYAADAWSLAWWTGLTSAGAGESSGSPAEIIPTGASDDAQITAASNIVNGSVLLYYTKGVTGCSPEAFVFGPLKIEDGSSAISATQFRFQTMISLSNSLGIGFATGGYQVNINGKDGVLAGSSGTTTTTGTTSSITVTSNVLKQRLNWRELTNFF